MRHCYLRFNFCVLFLIFLSGCAGMQGGYDSPAVSLTSFQLIPGKSIIPKFKIGLRIINPNRDALELEGIFYYITIEDHKIISGVANDLPTIQGYEAEDILLEASVDVVGGAKLLRSLIQTQKDSFRFSFNAKLDPGTFKPAIRISEQGEFSATNPGGNSVN